MFRFLKTFSSLNSFQALVSGQIRNVNSKHTKCNKCGFYSKNVEDEINKQIAIELSASYAYMSMFCHFARADVALVGCEKFFRKCAKEERMHAMKLCNYQTYRGGTIQLMNIEKPPKVCYSISDAFVSAAQLEKMLTEKLIEVKETAQRCDDDVTVDFIVTEFIREQVRKFDYNSASDKVLTTNFSSSAQRYSDVEPPYRPFGFVER